VLKLRVLERTRSPWFQFWIFRSSLTLSCPPALGEHQIVRVLDALLVDWHGVLEEIEPGRHRLNPLDNHCSKVAPTDECIVRIERTTPDRIRVSLRALFVLDGLTLAGFCLIALVVIPQAAPRFPWPIFLPFLVLYLVHYALLIRTARSNLDLLLESLSLQGHPTPERPRRIRTPRKRP